MKIVTLSGPARVSYSAKLQAILAKRNPKSFAAHILRNELNRVNRTATKNPRPAGDYIALLKSRLAMYPETTTVGKLIRKELELIRNQSFEGQTAAPVNGVGFLKKLRKKLKKLKPGRMLQKAAKSAGKRVQKVIDKIKTIALAPGRGAFLLIVKNNVRGIASKLALVPETAWRKKWKRFGGDPSKLATAINSGKKKKAFLGKGKLNGINGIEGIYQRSVVSELPDDDNTIGEPMTLAAALALAAPILAGFAALLKHLKGAKTPEGETVPDGIEIDDLKEVAEMAADKAGMPKSLPDDAVYTDADPGAGEDGGQPSGNKLIDDAGGSTFEPSTGLLLAGAALAFIVLSKKR